MALNFPHFNFMVSKIFAGAVRARMPSGDEQKAQIIADIPYVLPAEERRMLNVYLPAQPILAESGQCPVVVHVHGGGWKRGGRYKEFYGAPYMGRSYSQKGFVCVVVGYRLGVQHPSHVQDVAAALRWVHDHIEQFGGDPHRVFLSGHSAGGHLVSLVTLDPQYVRAEGLDPSFIKGVVSISGVYSLFNPLSTCDHSWKSFFYRKLYIRGAFGDDRPRLDQASPNHLVNTLYISQHVVANAERVMLSAEPALPSLATHSQPHIPPFLVINAEIDLGLEIDGQRFYESLQRAGCRAERLIVARTNHGSVTRNAVTVDHAVSFIKRECVCDPRAVFTATEQQQQQQQAVMN